MRCSSLFNSFGDSVLDGMMKKWVATQDCVMRLKSFRDRLTSSGLASQQLPAPGHGMRG